MPRLGIVHTSFALVEPLGALARTMLPETELVNIVDDTLLTYVREHGVDEKLTRRMCLCFKGAVEAGADLILSACSSVGETVDVARTKIEVPILKIDEPKPGDGDEAHRPDALAGGTIRVYGALSEREPGLARRVRRRVRARVSTRLQRGIIMEEPPAVRRDGGRFRPGLPFR